MRLLLKSIGQMRTALLFVLLGMSPVTPTMAYESIEDFTLLTPVNEEVLDSMRGGFQHHPDGPMMSFGIERSVFLNDKLINSTVLNIPDLSRLADKAGDAFTLVQHGGGNSVPHNLSSLPPLTTVIQNSLDNQAIQSHTVINATVSALTWARALDLGNALSQASIEAIRH
ncbi:MAG: hypothetical protein H8K07_17120 [Nitrospira sp.]|jgi:hypothetical protein|nr:hypothetical protein [Nitrospira sp.]MDI3462868.1 hypothetical protein [Nitrospira sp.]